MNTANQASENELKDRIGNLHAYNFDGDDVTVKVMVDEDILERIAKYVKAIIRTEKLKLLAEVREQTTIFKIKAHDKKGQPHLYEAGRGVPTEVLTKLEEKL